MTEFPSPIHGVIDAKIKLVRRHDIRIGDYVLWSNHLMKVTNIQGHHEIIHIVDAVDPGVIGEYTTYMFYYKVVCATIQFDGPIGEYGTEIIATGVCEWDETKREMNITIKQEESDGP